MALPNSEMDNRQTCSCQPNDDHSLYIGLIGKWHLGLNCENNKDSCHNPLNSGFHEYYGLPFTNARGECTRPEDGVAAVKNYEKASRQLVLAIFALGLGLCVLGILSLKSVLITVLVFGTCLSMGYLVLKTNFAKLNCVLMRNYEVVEQPVIMENLTVRLTAEARSFIKRHKEQPFLLFFSFVKVHTSLFASPKFKGK